MRMLNQARSAVMSLTGEGQQDHLLLLGEARFLPVADVEGEQKADYARQAQSAHARRDHVTHATLATKASHQA